MRTARVAGVAAWLLAVEASAQPRPTTPAPAPTASDAAQQLGEAFTAVAARTLPSVVAIFVEITRRADDLAPMGGFWGLAPEGGSPVRHGSGSGVIVRADGAILTNHHVVEGASRIRVRLADGRALPARLVGSDEATDLAVLRVDATGLTPARLGDSDAARVGEWVLAVGAPFGLEATVTHGVLSAKGRGGFGVNQIEDYLQTDASINPGNSGGALVNLRGEVLGINTLILGRGQGIGFAVPSRIAERVTTQILRDGRVTRGWLGFSAQDLTQDLEQAFRATAHSGVLVNLVYPGGPADRGGLRLGDVVVAVDGHPVRSDHEVQRELSDHGLNERVVLSVQRGGQRSELTLTTALRPGESTAPPPPPPPPDPGPTGFGVVVDAIPAQLATRFGLSPGVGVVIVQVARGGAADRAGLRPGDVILIADGSDVRSPDDVVRAARDGSAVCLVRRGDAQQWVNLAIRSER